MSSVGIIDCGGSCRIDDYPSTFPECFDALHCPRQIVVALPVNEKRIGAGLGKLVHEKIRICYHQVGF